MTPLVPSEMACLASSPGRMRRTAVWISLEEIVDFLLYEASLDASPAMRSKMSLTKELWLYHVSIQKSMFMMLLEDKLTSRSS